MAGLLDFLDQWQSFNDRFDPKVRLLEQQKKNQLEEIAMRAAVEAKQKERDEQQAMVNQAQRFSSAPSIPLQPSLLVKHFIDEASRTGLPPSQATIGGLIQGAYRPEQRGVGMISPFTEKGNSVSLPIPTSKMTTEQEGQYFQRGMMGPEARQEQDALARAKAIKEASFSPDKSPTFEDDLQAEAVRLQREGALRTPQEVFNWKNEKRQDQAESISGSRTKGNLEAIAKYGQAAAEARTRGTKVVQLEYLPQEVRARVQTELNVATDPKNIALVSSKIEQEETARQKGRPLDATIQDRVALLQQTKAALNELNTQFTPEERKQFVGIFNNPIKRALQIANGDKRFAEFQALMGRIKKAAFDDGGKQLTPFEFSIVSQYVPQGNENSWEDFESKLALAGDYTDMLIKGRLDIASRTKGQIQREGLPQPSLGKSAPQDLSKMSTEELLKMLGK